MILWWWFDLATLYRRRILLGSVIRDAECEQGFALGKSDTILALETPAVSGHRGQVTPGEAGADRQRPLTDRLGTDLPQHSPNTAPRRITSANQTRCASDSAAMLGFLPSRLGTSLEQLRFISMSLF